MDWLKGRQVKKEQRRRREGYRTTGTVVMPELDVPLDFDPPTAAPEPIKDELAWQVMAVDEAMMALRYEIDGLKAALGLLEPTTSASLSE